MATVIFDTTNTDTVQNGPLFPTVFGVAQPTLLTHVSLYFWNNGRGANPGLVVRLADTALGLTYGPFNPVLSSGQGGAPNVNVDIYPNIVIPPGKYQVVPSDTTLWSHNPRSGDQGIVLVEGTVTTTVAPPPTGEYERATWAVGPPPPGASGILATPQTILWLQPVGTSTYLTVYRVTNGEASSPVTIQTSGGDFLLNPGVSADISAQKIAIQSTGQAAWGSYQQLCCALAVPPPIPVTKPPPDATPPASPPPPPAED